MLIQMTLDLLLVHDFRDVTQAKVMRVESLKPFDNLLLNFVFSEPRVITASLIECMRKVLNVHQECRLFRIRNIVIEDYFQTFLHYLKVGYTS